MEVHVLASGSDGNCVVIEHDGRAVMVDAGLSLKRIAALMDLNGLEPSSLEAILVTHEHTDHTRGVGPVARKFDVPVYCNPPTLAGGQFGRVRHVAISTLNPFSVAGFEVTPLPTSHNAAEPNAFRVAADGRNVLVATDTGYMTPEVEEALAGADAVLLESNYDAGMLRDGPYPHFLKRLIDSDLGHLSNVACAEALRRTSGDGRRKVFLAHLSRNNNTPDTARETVSEITGMKRMTVDCLEFPGDTRVIRV
ncbi:MAG: MBL fold metallo-hydrolase [Thermoplasmatales archaeon]|nr:MBL fold metallo-hydrolase [Thermoplasmatales archaeon]